MQHIVERNLSSAQIKMFFNKDFIIGAAVGVAIATGAHYLYNRLRTTKDNDNDETTITKMEEDILLSDSKRQIIVADHAVSASATKSMAANLT